MWSWRGSRRQRRRNQQPLHHRLMGPQILRQRRMMIRTMKKNLTWTKFLPGGWRRCLTKRWVHRKLDLCQSSLTQFYFAVAPVYWTWGEGSRWTWSLWHSWCGCRDGLGTLSSFVTHASLLCFLTLRTLLSFLTLCNPSTAHWLWSLLPVICTKQWCWGRTPLPEGHKISETPHCPCSASDSDVSAVLPKLQKKNKKSKAKVSLVWWD